MKGLGIGRIVHFHPPTTDQSVGEAQAAIVTRLCEDDGVVDLTVFPNGDSALRVRKVPHSKEPAPYSWHWPPQA